MLPEACDTRAMDGRWAAPAWLRLVLVSTALGLVTLGLAIEWIRIADLAGCTERAQTEAIACPAPPPSYEVPLALAIEVVVAVVAVVEIRADRA